MAPGILATNAHVIDGEYLAFLRITFPGAKETLDAPGSNPLPKSMQGVRPFGGMAQDSPPFGGMAGFSRGNSNGGMYGGRRIGDMDGAPPRVLEPSGPVRLIFQDKKRDLANFLPFRRPEAE